NGQQPDRAPTTRVLLYGLGRSRLQETAEELDVPVQPVDSLEQADIVLTLKSAYRRQAPLLKAAQAAGVPVYVLRSNTPFQLAQALKTLRESREPAAPDAAMTEAEEAISRVKAGQEAVDLSPQNSYVRRLQHQLAEQHQVASQSRGREPFRRVRIFRSGSLGRES
ncbi:MAG: AAA family ATPase, partial [SAR202 cluster bacterium]|nr:AAA family ATPase [SAR202 cluster bacterium]